ncbi:MAG TPA: Lsr2 family protein [Jiangellaceae bacterium]|nr:Lsr2 family protein [Jiangellaceae bacterium]
MAQRVQVILVDDIDGGNAEETVSFSLDGVAYELDLSRKNAAKLRDTLGPYIGSARRVSRRGGRGRGRSGGGRGTDTASVRQWARDQGLKVSDRGRVPADILARYEAAHS